MLTLRSSWAAALCLPAGRLASQINPTKYAAGSPADSQRQIMSESTFTYINRPGPAGMTTQPVYRGTKTADELGAEIQTRIGSAPLTVPLVLQTASEVIIDWTIETWKVALPGDLIEFLCGSGGSAPVGQPIPDDFAGMHINLRAHWTDTGAKRAEAAFSAEKVGEQGRVVPVWVEVYDSDSHLPNHYVAGKALTSIMANKRIKFDPSNGSKIRFQKTDGTWTDATSYPYIKGGTIVCIVPAGLTGALVMEMTCELNGTIRSGPYPFPLI